MYLTFKIVPQLVSCRQFLTSAVICFPCLSDVNLLVAILYIAILSRKAGTKRGRGYKKLVFTIPLFLQDNLTLILFHVFFVIYFLFKCSLYGMIDLVDICSVYLRLLLCISKSHVYLIIRQKSLFPGICTSIAGSPDRSLEVMVVSVL